MSEKQLTEGTSALGSSQQRVIIINAKEQPQEIKLRVAAYARVSTASDDQINSFDAQSKHYTDLIASKENWQIVDIYADRGISGRTAEKREDFQRLLSDCRKGKIDRILVKSISRFARNTKECLELVRELKLLGISVYFEKENIDTAKMSGEMMTAMFASLAQAESQSISGNMRWGYQKRMASGTFIPSTVPYGYRLVERTIEVEPAEAEVVRWIYQAYLSGESKDEIADKLSELEVAPLSGKPWQYRAVAYILANEFYAGDSRWQKRYMTDTFPPRLIVNQGERPQYYAEDHHSAIISREDFQKAQNLRHERRERYAISQTVKENPLRRMIRCGCCGSPTRRSVSNDATYWVCAVHKKDSHACPVKPIPEDSIQKAFLRLYYKLKHQAQPLLSEMLANLQSVRNKRMLWSADVVELNQKISEISSQNQMLAELNRQGLIDPDFFISQSNGLAEQLRTAKQEKECMLDATGDKTISQTRELVEILENGPDFLDTFDEALFSELVEQIVIESNVTLRFRLFNGLEVQEIIERTVR